MRASPGAFTNGVLLKMKGRLTPNSRLGDICRSTPTIAIQEASFTGDVRTFLLQLTSAAKCN
eukprot:752060-Hanusia_phi.AAC.3